METQRVIRTRHLAVFELGLRDGGTEVDVPERRRLGLVGLAPRQVVQERALAGAPGGIADRRVGETPVDRQSEAAPELLERLLVLGDEALAELEEVRARDRDDVLTRFLGRNEVQVRFAAHAVVVLDAPLGGQAVVVPAHGIEDVTPPHALVPRDRVGLHVTEGRAHVQRTADRRRWRVDREDLVARVRSIEPVGPVLLPDHRPARLEPDERRFVGDGGHAPDCRRHLLGDSSHDFLAPLRAPGQLQSSAREQ